MTVIQVHLPDDLARKVSRLSDNVEAYIVDFLRSQVREASLADEYRLAGDENKELLKDFESVDMDSGFTNPPTFNALKLKTKGFKFDREEANAR